MYSLYLSSYLLFTIKTNPRSTVIWYSFTHSHRWFGYRNIPHPLSESVERLMYLRVYDRWDNSYKSVPSPSLWYSFTHTHRSIGYRNIPHPLTVSPTRLMYLRVYDNRDRSGKFSPFPSLLYSFTHIHTGSLVIVLHQVCVKRLLSPQTLVLRLS